MPATDQTWYSLKLLHRLFAVASLALLATTVWMLARDHRRPWKEYQRTARRIESLTAAWRQYQSPTGQDPGAASTAELSQLEAAAARDSQYFYFEHGLPWPGKRLLELPILDAFNSPLQIENLWAEGLTQDLNFRQVPRFDRCTTCHTAMQKTEPGSPDAPAYPGEQLLQFTVSVGAGAPRLTATQRGARETNAAAAPAATSTPGNATSPAATLEPSLGLLLASQGLLRPDDATVCYVRPGSPAATAVLTTPPPVAQSAEQILSAQFRIGAATPVPQLAPGLRAGDVLVAVNGVPVAGREQAVAQLLAAASQPPLAAAGNAAKGEAPGDDEDRDDDEPPGQTATTPTLQLTVRRGLPHPFASHPRLDLFVGESSPHKLSDFACTICHEGQGSATEFRWASHAPNDLADRQRWRGQHGWFDNPSWDFPMLPQRFVESACPKCHHRVVDLQPSERFPQPPAPKLLRGYTLVRTYGCYGCHEINGFQDGKSVGPDLRTEPAAAIEAQTASPFPGRQRPPGPSLRYLDGSWTDAFLHDWLLDPRRFRPATRMPRVFGQWNHLDGPSRQLAEQYEPLEIRGIVAYLRQGAQAAAPAAAPAGVTPGSAQDQAARGRVLFQTRGCLACHTHAAFADADPFRDPDELVAGPDLSNIAGKLAGDTGLAWLTEFIRQPARHLPRTIMPDLLLEPISQRDAAGQVLALTDPAADLAQFLLQESRADYQPRPLPEVDTATLDQLTVEYLRGMFRDSQARQYVQQGIPAELANTLPAAERELLSPSGPGPTKPTVEQKLRYIGSKSITRYGCFGCHDIAGFETAKQIGPPLSDWGRKQPSLLAFEKISAYLAAHGENLLPAEAVSPEAAANAAYFRQQLDAGTRIGFLHQKLAEPRSYDYQVVANKAYRDRLRMPLFPFTAEDREAIMTFVLGLVAQPPTDKYVSTLKATRAAIVDGQELLERYKCASCHVLEPQKWHLAYEPGSFQPPPEKPVFPWVAHPFPPDQLERSRQPDARGLLHATVVGMPTLADDGRPLVFDDCGDELFEDEPYLPPTLEYPFQLWQPAALDGRSYQVGQVTVKILGDQIVARQRARGGFLAQYLLPHVTKLERAANPNAKGSQAWGWLPPPLLGEGAKVQPGWLHDYLLAPEVVRPASFLRMPKYSLSAEEAAALVRYFAAQDGAAYPYQSIERRSRAYLQQAAAEFRQQPPAADAPANAAASPDSDRLSAAMRIVTDKNYCITCHLVGDFAPQTSDRAKGPNLADVYRRFRPDYVRRWIAEPVSVLPYTGMPIIIPFQPDAPHQGGVAQTLYPGTSVQQLDSLVDLLMNFDAYTRQRASVTPLISGPSGR